MADLAFLAPGRKVVAAEPTFEAVLSYARRDRAEATKVPLTADFRHDPAQDGVGLRRADRPRLRLQPRTNPTGTIVKRAEMVAFVASVPESAVVLVTRLTNHFRRGPD
jgi:histidinol-phosphate aminotransferase